MHPYLLSFGCVSTELNQILSQWEMKMALCSDNILHMWLKHKATIMHSNNESQDDIDLAVLLQAALGNE